MNLYDNVELWMFNAQWIRMKILLVDKPICGKRTGGLIKEGCSILTVGVRIMVVEAEIC